MVKKFFPFVIIILFAVIGGFSLLHKGLPPTHDGEYHIIRFYEFNRALQDGNWYPRWAPDLNNGFGVPLFNYVYPLPNYIASFFHLLGISFIDAFKLEMFFALIIGGIFFYLWAKEFWGVTGGVVSSVFYSFSPYHFVDIYIRGSVGEVWALAFFPAFLWSITQFIRGKQKNFFILSAIFLALIIFSHNILALIFTVFSLFYMGFLIFQEKDKRYLLVNDFFIILLGLGLSSIFWLPALFETQYVRGLQIYDVKGHFPQFYQLLIPSWGSGFLKDDLSNQTSFQIGAANLLAVLTSILVGFKYKKKDKTASIIVFFLIWFAFIFFLMLKISLPIWEHLPLMNYFQFPWRFLSLEILIASFLAGSITKLRYSKISAVVMILLVYLLGVNYTKPAYYHERNDVYYLIRSNFIDGTNSSGNLFNTVWMNTNLEKQKDRVRVIKGDMEIKFWEIKAAKYIFKAAVKQGSEIVINTAYFPGWTVFIDKVKTEVLPSRDGLIQVQIPKGNHTIIVSFENTTVRQIASLLFYLSSLILFVLLFKKQFVTINK